MWYHVVLFKCSFPDGSAVKKLPATQKMKETCVRSWARKIPWSRNWQPTPVIVPEKSHGQRSLVSYSSNGCKRIGHSWMTGHTELSLYNMWLCVSSATQSCPALCNPKDFSSPGSFVHWIFKQEYRSILSVPMPKDLPNPGIESTSLVSPALSGKFFTIVPPEKPP